MKKSNRKMMLAFLCILALSVSFLSAAAVADENEYIIVNGEKRVFTAEGEVSAVLKLPVEVAGRIHILANGVNVALAVYNEDTFEVCGVYYTDNGLMDVPFDAYPGNYLLGFTGWNEVAVLVADESTTARLYASAEAETASDKLPIEQSEVIVDPEFTEEDEELAEEPDEEKKPAGKAAEEVKEVTEKPTEEVTEEPEKDLPPIEQEDREAVDEVSPAEAAETPSDLIRYEFKDGRPVSVLSILNEAGAEVNMVRKVTRESDGCFSSLGSSDGDWLLTPFAYFDSIEVSVTAGRFDATDASIEDAVYTLVLSYPDPAAEAESEKEMTEEAAEEPAEEPAEEVAEEPAEEAADEAEEELPPTGQEDREAEDEEAPAAAAETPSHLIWYEFKDGSPVSVLSILNEVGAEVNMIRKVTRESDGWFFSTGSSDGDWLLTPYAYFDSIEVSVTAGWFDTTDASITDEEYILKLSYPDPAAVEGVTESEESLLSGRDVTIAMERLKGNEIRLYAENRETEEDLHYQWQYSMDSENWIDVENANSSEYAFTLNSTNSSKYWRLVVTK